MQTRTSVATGLASGCASPCSPAAAGQRTLGRAHLTATYSWPEHVHPCLQVLDVSCTPADMHGAWPQISDAKGDELSYPKAVLSLPFSDSDDTFFYLDDYHVNCAGDYVDAGGGKVRQVTVLAPGLLALLLTRCGLAACEGVASAGVGSQPGVCAADPPCSRTSLPCFLA